MSTRNQWFLVLLVLAVVPFALHARLLRGEALLAGDLLSLMDPWKGEGGVGPAYNKLPLDPLRSSYPTAALEDEFGTTRWNPRQLMGEPVGAFLEPYTDYPPQRVVHWLLPAWLALGVYSWLSLLAGGWVFCAYLALGRGLPLRAALFGALAYQLSTWGTLFLGASGIVVGFAPWAAAVLWSAERLGKRASLARATACGLCLGGAIWAGSPPAVVPLCGVLALGAVAHARPRCWPAMVGWVALAGAIGVSASALRLLPAALEFLACTRDASDASEGLRLTLTHGLTALVPDLLGHPLRGFNLLAAERGSYANHTEVRLYVGYAVLVFAGFGLLRAPRRTLPWGAVAATALLLGSDLPLVREVWGFLPGLRATTPTRMVAALHLIAPLLAAEGFAHRARPGRALPGVALGAVAGILVLGLLTGTRLGVSCLVPEGNAALAVLVEPLTGLLPLWGEWVDVEGPTRTKTLLSPTLGPLLLALGGLAACWIARGPTRRKRIAGALWAALLVGDLLREAMVFTPATPRDQLHPLTPGLRVLKEASQGGRVALGRGVWSNTLAPLGFHELGGFSSVRSRRIDAMLQASGAALGRYTARPANLRGPWRDALALCAVITGPDREPPRVAGLERIYAGRDCQVWKNPTALPRVRGMPIRGVRWVADRTQAEAAIGSPEFDPRTQVVLEGTSPGGVHGDSAAVSDLKDLGGELRCRVRAQQPSVILISDRYDPGWSARWEGQDVPVYPANVGLRGVVVPAGEGELVLHYAPQGWWIGLLISGLTLGASAWVLRR